MEQIILAAGPFRSVQNHFAGIEGIVSITEGYSGGDTENPTASEVRDQATGHAEAVLIEYDSDKLTTEQLLRRFFKLDKQDPMDSATGNQYRHIIYYVTDEQREVAERLMVELEPHDDATNASMLQQAGPFYRK